MQEKFLPSGQDDELDPFADIWRKGIVYTARAAPAMSRGYRVSVGFKRGVSAERPLTSFRDLYDRVAFVGRQRIPDGAIVCQGWRLLGDTGNIAAAFITLAVRSQDLAGEPSPTDDELSAPGGASLADLARLAPQRADEIYNEFDFTDPSAATHLITVSYAEPIPEIPGGESTDFKPFVDRAERFANSYHHLLQHFGEVNTPFRPTHREWFLADRKLVTVHICFSR